MKEVIKQHGGAVIEAAGVIMVIGITAGVILGGGLSGVAHLFSKWLYG